MDEETKNKLLSGAFLFTASVTAPFVIDHAVSKELEVEAANFDKNITPLIQVQKQNEFERDVDEWYKEMKKKDVAESNIEAANITKRILDDQREQREIHEKAWQAPPPAFFEIDSGILNEIGELVDEMIEADFGAKKVSSTNAKFKDRFEWYVGRKLKKGFSFDNNPADIGTLKRISNFSDKEFNLVYTLFYAISEQESSHDYTELGVLIKNKKSDWYNQRAIGRYQIMEGNWKQWTKEIFGRVVEPDARAQDIVAFHNVAKRYRFWKKMGFKQSDVVKLTAVNWYGNNGKRLRGVKDISAIKSCGVSPRMYASSVLAKFHRKYNKN